MASLAEKKAHLWDREPDQWYVEPPWVSRCLCEAEDFAGVVVDPFAGMGNVREGAREAGVAIAGYDLRWRSRFPDITGGVDFFGPQLPGRYPVDCIVTNPPYGRRPSAEPGERARWEEEVVRIALDRARCKVALFLDSGWLNSAARGAWLATLPLYRVYKVGPRPPCPPGPFLMAGGRTGNGRTDYCWVVFLRGFAGAPSLHWLRREGGP